MFNIALDLSTEGMTMAADGGFYGKRIVNNVLVLGGFLLGALIWWLALTSTITLFRKRFRPRQKLPNNRIAGVVISALGIITIISVIID